MCLLFVYVAQYDVNRIEQYEVNFSFILCCEVTVHDVIYTCVQLILKFISPENEIPYDKKLFYHFNLFFNYKYLSRFTTHRVCFFHWYIFHRKLQTAFNKPVYLIRNLYGTMEI